MPTIIKEPVLRDLLKMEDMTAYIHHTLILADNVEPMVLAKISTAREALMEAYKMLKDTNANNG